MQSSQVKNDTQRNSPCKYTVPSALPLTELDRLEKPEISTQEAEPTAAEQRYRNNTATIMMTQTPKEPLLPTQIKGCVMLPRMRKKLRSLPGNENCCDCGAPDPQWASTSLASLVCLQCACAHRSLGVLKSRVRSLELDTWSPSQILRMFAGGNGRLQAVFGADCDQWTKADPISAATARERYDSAIAKRYRDTLDAECDPTSDSDSDSDDAPGFGQFMMDQVNRVRRASVHLVSPCAMRASAAAGNENRATMFCCIGVSFCKMFKNLFK